MTKAENPTGEPRPKVTLPVTTFLARYEAAESKRWHQDNPNRRTEMVDKKIKD